MMISDLLHNSMFWAGGLAWLTSQVIKVLYYTIRNIRNGGFRMEFLTGSGGFPSSHSATVIGLLVMAARWQGLNSPAFAIAFFLACVVIYDAAGVRSETGRQSKVLNQLVREQPELAKYDPSLAKPFDEKVGHTVPEIIAGIVIGLIVGMLVPLM